MKMTMVNPALKGLTPILSKKCFSVLCPLAHISRSVVHIFRFQFTYNPRWQPTSDRYSIDTLDKTIYKKTVDIRKMYQIKSSLFSIVSCALIASLVII